jgi:PAS domain-containing protein
MFRKQFTDVEDACLLAHAIVDTVREPLVVVDQDLRVVAASRSFYRTFGCNPEEPKASCFTSWAIVNGISHSYVCF